jgi:hypothetical protein
MPPTARASELAGLAAQEPVEQRYLTGAVLAADGGRTTI